MAIKYISFPTKRSYGVELELTSSISAQNISQAIKTVDKSRQVAVTGYSHSSNNDFWHVKPDSSCGWEIASYKSRGVDDLLNIVQVTKSVQDSGGVVNNNCGLHVHVEVKDYSKKQMAILLATWLKIERVFFEAIPSHRINNKYCVSLNENIDPTVEFFGDNEIKVFWRKYSPNPFGNMTKQRRVTMNLCNYCFSDKKTVEFRFPEGTLDGEDVKNWIRLFVRFVTFTKKKEFPSSVKGVDLRQALSYLGLFGNGEDFFLLSRGLRETKEWFLRRIIKHGKIPSIFTEATALLNEMWFPIKRFDLSADYGVLVEAV